MISLHIEAKGLTLLAVEGIASHSDALAITDALIEGIHPAIDTSVLKVSILTIGDAE